VLDSETLPVFDPVAVWIGAAMPLLLGTFILSFPSGRLPRGRWRPVMWVAVGLTISGFSTAAMTGDEATMVAVPLVLFVVAALVDLIVRYRKFDSGQKAQAKLVVFAAALTPVVLVASTFAVDDEDLLGVVAVAAFMIVPTAIGVAMASFRLYDIDRIISRTVTYAVVVGLLAATYVAMVWVVTSLLPAQGSLAVAASTLVVAAIFNPMRTRVQRLIDRRFNRSRYRAEIISEEFSLQLKGSLTVAEVADELTRTVERTLQPQTSALWIAWTTVE
jgi:hypothetical protein